MSYFCKRSALRHINTREALIIAHTKEEEEEQKRRRAFL